MAMGKTLQWPVLIWVLMALTYTGCQSESNVDYFQILKYPTEWSGYDFNNQSTLELCYDDADGPALPTSLLPHQALYSPVGVYNTLLLNILRNIAHQLQQSQSGQSNRPLSISTMSESTMPLQMESEAKTMASAQRSLRVYVKGQQQPEDFEEQFDILEQLKLDEQKDQQKLRQKLKSQLQSQLETQKQQPVNEQQQAEFWEDKSLEHHQAKAGSKQKKKKKRKRKRKQKPTKDKMKKQKKPTQQPLVGQPAHVLFASLTQRPQFHQQPHLSQPLTTTSKPQYSHQFAPMKKIKYILRKNTIFKKKKKEYLNHLKHVLYPFVKFIAFFTVLNPFTLAVFLFALISPVVFGFIGFIGLSFLIKPALNLLFGVKRTISSINRKKWLEKKRRERLRQSRRPITIHKHYYQQTRLPPPPQHHGHRHRHPLRRPQSQKHSHHRQSRHFNPLLPQLKRKFKEDTWDMLRPNFI
ncbi:uncharacterized protein LOC142235739 [Haematobia irritans]|uniref:uncharacterized protein LOC142235739 n=1 Tax=Haematobia irritans TaxID=7368 RepID=UPI003F506494